MAKIDFMTQIILWQNSQLGHASKNSAGKSSDASRSSGSPDYITVYSDDPSKYITKTKAYLDGFGLFGRIGTEN